MTAEELARLHAACFDHAPRAWSAAEFADLLALPANKLIYAQHGFALVQMAGPEAEILTVAVDPAHRRQGIARSLMAELITLARAHGASALFLEVAQTNAAARALYVAEGFAEIGTRKNYYSGPGGQKTTAIVMRQDL